MKITHRLQKRLAFRPWFWEVTVQTLDLKFYCPELMIKAYDDWFVRVGEPRCRNKVFLGGKNFTMAVNSKYRLRKDFLVWNTSGCVGRETGQVKWDGITLGSEHTSSCLNMQTRNCFSQILWHTITTGITREFFFFFSNLIRALFHLILFIYFLFSLLFQISDLHPQRKENFDLHLHLKPKSQFYINTQTGTRRTRV